ncbi:flagellar protein FlbD [Iocasia frigidifontis]|uniref:Flagellar protein FlbD n=1 Tax=Iocasia fonsfrigidae TaxID=2682810 RepID=A0A8A7KA45_9FIRM|nr:MULTISPECIES: flagellar FlbD family protein [Halanaerobiaceae]AZO94046.1 flagellar protein FlbD [Halocella sp. SP3-1]MTI58789.1 flagellar protein FlbD [Bacillota bacterium]QTL96965.1 flagellar protein FlbD [Iocasia fonsfrigidae]
MVKLKKINGEEIVVNARLIETVQATPDTVITLTTNKKILVMDDVDDIVEKVIDYHQKIFSNVSIEKG